MINGARDYHKSTGAALLLTARKNHSLRAAAFLHIINYSFRSHREECGGCDGGCGGSGSDGRKRWR